MPNRLPSNYRVDAATLALIFTETTEDRYEREIKELEKKVNSLESRVSELVDKFELLMKTSNSMNEIVARGEKDGSDDV